MRDPSGVFKYTEWYYLRALDTRGALDSSVKNNTCLATPRSTAYDETVASVSICPLRDLNLEMILRSPEKLNRSRQLDMDFERILC